MDRIQRGTPLKSVLLDADKLRLFAEAFGVSLREIARRMEVSNGYVDKILKDRRISAPKAEKLVQVLQQIARKKRLSPFAFLRELPQSDAQVLPMRAPDDQAPPSEVA